MASTSFKALAADKSVTGVKKNDRYMVDPKILVEEPGFNLRDYNDPEVIEHIEQFAQAYAQGLPVPPLMTRVDDQGRVVIVEGHCRTRGALLAISRGFDIPFLDTVPFRGNDAERDEFMLRSAQGLALKPLAVALGYLRLINKGYSEANIAQRMSKTRTHVEGMLLLASANSDVHELVRSDKVKATTAIEVVRVHGERAGAYLAIKIAEKGGALLESGGKVKKAVLTIGDIKEWAPTRSMASHMHGSIANVVSKLDRATLIKLAEFEKLDANALEGESIQVDARAFLDLFKAHCAASEAKKAKETAAAIAKEAATQQPLPMDGTSTNAA